MNKMDIPSGIFKMLPRYPGTTLCEGRYKDSFYCRYNTFIRMGGLFAIICVLLYFYFLKTKR